MQTPPFSFKPSVQQSAFFDWILNGFGSCVLEAVAGAGKTTTLIEALKLMKGKIFFGAYNKKIAEEIQARAPQMKMGLSISTMHAAGMKAWGSVARAQVNADKCRDIFRDMTFRQMEYGILEGPVLQLVSYAKQSAMYVLNEGKREDWMQLIVHFDVQVFDEVRNRDNTEDIIGLATEVLKRSTRLDTKVIDYDDMIFSPLFHNVTFPKYDWVLIDEAQDTNASRRELSLRMLKDGGRLVAVGDRHQAIYGFTGADADSLDKIAAAVNAVWMPLNVTFRCPKSVVAHAHKWVKHIQAHDTAPEGIVREAQVEELQSIAKVGDAILCRFNAPLIKYVYQLIAAGVPARVEGREIGAGLKQLANRWKVKEIGQLLDKLDEFQDREVEKYVAKEQPKKAQDVIDKVECLRVIIARVMAKGTITKPPQLAVIAEIDAIFGTDAKGDSKPVVLLSSIHKSKGREFGRVIWLVTGPSGFAKKDWEIEQENNLCYVATTRAMKELVLINIGK